MWRGSLFVKIENSYEESGGTQRSCTPAQRTIRISNAIQRACLVYIPKIFVCGADELSNEISIIYSNVIPSAFGRCNALTKEN